MEIAFKEMCMDDDKKLSKIGQGYNDVRGEIPDKKDIPKNNGQNLNNDPAHHRGNEKQAPPKAVLMAE
jgi:hypothetical protein